MNLLMFGKVAIVALASGYKPKLKDTYVLKNNAYFLSYIIIYKTKKKLILLKLIL